MRILVTGAAGFIGMHTAQRLLARGDEVFGVDNLNDYYDVRLKQDRLRQLEAYPQFHFQKLDIADVEAMQRYFAEIKPHRVIHLAAQAGVRYSLKNPHAYAQSNLVGFVNILEGCRQNQVEHLVYASTSSVYGANTKMPFSEHDNVDHPVSLYAATKKANEAMAHSYSHLYGLPTTGLRFFTVYGPWGRPDMSAYLFANAILEGRPIDVFNEGKMRRDFTYVDDIVTGVVATVDNIAASDPSFDLAAPDPASSYAPYRIYNIGNNEPVELMSFIECLEKAIGKKAVFNMLPMQAGDVVATYADVQALKQAVGFAPSTPLEVGIERFVDWYRSYTKA
ncbi:MAG TPA: NAD-dependent epimerase [Burkholderiales bacterium]|nr:NAD-dependent epimerase [Burkholderiales bacterium]